MLLLFRVAIVKNILSVNWLIASLAVWKYDNKHNNSRYPLLLQWQSNDSNNTFCNQNDACWTMNMLQIIFITSKKQPIIFQKQTQGKKKVKVLNFYTVSIILVKIQMLWCFVLFDHVIKFLHDGCVLLCECKVHYS